MDLLQLKYFCEIAREEHITRAAKNLNIAQPALSASLNRLEKELGVSLFDRVGRNISLNSCGQAFYQHISPALLLIENGIRAMEDFRTSEKNSLTLVPPSARAFSRRLSSPTGNNTRISASASFPWIPGMWNRK